MVGKTPLSTVATFSKVLCVNYHRFPSQSHQVVIIIPMDSLTPFGEASSLYYTEKCESPKCVEAHKMFYIFTSTIKKLDFSFQNIYNKGTKFSVCLAVSLLVVRRTFYSIVNDRDLALKIRLLFSVAIQLTVVEHIIQPLVVNVNDFLQKFKIIF